MKPLRGWIMAYAIGVAAVIACAGTQAERDWNGSAPPDGFSDGGASPSSGGSSSSGGYGSFGYDGNLPSPGPTANTACQPGHYVGTFNGSYSSHLIIGIPLTVTGNVDMTLDQAGDAGTQCMYNGEFMNCSNFFVVSGGTITGVANGSAEGGKSGYPYFCQLTGTLDCPNKKLIGGWINCTYCVGSLDSTGMACAPAFGGFLPGIGGQFAGPVTADYDTSKFSLVNGTWNGAEALAGVDAGTTTWNGMPVSNYLSDAGYGIGNYGGNGTWNATHQ
jgi:hypothetical protein